MGWTYRLRDLPKELKLLALMFLLSMLFGYGASFLILADQTSLSPAGIEENYNGNEVDEQATILKFKKSNYEMLTTVHTHVFSLSVIFLIVGAMAYFTGLPLKLRFFLMIEPLVSLMITFTSLILMWQGFILFKYLVALSGIMMHGAFLVTVLSLIRELYFTRTA